MSETTRDPLEEFVQTIIRDAKLDGLAEESKEAIIQRLRDEAQRRVGIIALQHLDEKGIDEFQAMALAVSPPDPAAVQAFLSERIPDFENVLRDGLAAFAQEFITAAKPEPAA